MTNLGKVMDLAATRKALETSDRMHTLALEHLVDYHRKATARIKELEDRVADLTGTPRGEGIHFLVFKGEEEPSGKTLLVHFYGSSGKRLVGRSRSGHLGVALFSYRAPELATLRDGIEAFGLGVLTEPTHVEGLYGPQRVMLAVGPNEELFEFVA